MKHTLIIVLMIASAFEPLTLTATIYWAMVICGLCGLIGLQSKYNTKQGTQ